MDSIDSGCQSLANSFRAFHMIREKVTAYCVVLFRTMNTRRCQDASAEWKSGSQCGRLAQCAERILSVSSDFLTY